MISKDWYDNDTKTLTIPYTFNKELKDIPEDVKILIFSGDVFPYYSGFNKKVDNLPKSLTHLTFNGTFNKKVNNLPHGLTHLTFGHLKNIKEYNSLIFLDAPA
jgi:hypothetical protein